MIPELNTHVGVLEFIAEEGTVNLPQWVRHPRPFFLSFPANDYDGAQIMDQLRLNEGDPIRIRGGRYPKGKHVKIQPQSVDFLEISDPKAVYAPLLTSNSYLLLLTPSLFPFARTQTRKRPPKLFRPLSKRHYRNRLRFSILPHLDHGNRPRRRRHFRHRH